MKPDAVGRVGEDNDGLVIELTWRVVDGIIEDAKFRAFGNPNAIAITSLMTDNIIGKSVDEAMLVNEDVIIEALEEFKPEYLETYDMVHQAILEAHHNYLKRQSRKDNAEVEIRANEEYVYTEGDEQIDISQQIQLELQGTTKTVSRGRGRPRKERPEGEIEIVGEKRGRGRPRKERPEGEEEIVTEKRGRGRPRKERPEGEIEIVGEKRGRGRPRKERPEGEEEIVTEKRGRGRPRKERPEGEIEIVGEKRGRGRPRKERPEGEEAVATEKRGRGRPRKIVDESATVEVGEKRGRGRPRKEVVFNLPNDLDQVIEDEEVEQLIAGNATAIATETTTNEIKQSSTDTFVDNLISNKLIDEDDDTFDADYDLFKSNIRNIFSGKEVNNSTSYGEAKMKSNLSEVVEIEPVAENQFEAIEDEEDLQANENQANEITPTETSTATEHADSVIVEEKRGRGRPRKERPEGEEVVTEKRGRGRPRKIVDESATIEVGEKRGRGRPKKIVIENVESAKPTQTKLETTNSLTRSLSSAGGVPSFRNTQDIVFASKNVTTTNININVTKTTTIDDNQSVNDYSKNVNISSVKENSTITIPAKDIDEDDEIEVDQIENKNLNQGVSTFDDFEDDRDEEIDDEIDAFDYQPDDEDDDEDDIEQEYEDDIDDMEDEEEIDDSHIKDEAPKGGIEDLLKALLNDD